MDVWNDFKAESMTVAAGVRVLSDARDSGTVLSARSMDLLSIESLSDRQLYVDQMKDVAYVQSTLITCMEILKKETEDFDSVSLLVVGTEAGQLLILPQDPVNSSCLCKVMLPSAPVILSVTGVFDVEWRINVVCRDGRMYSVKNGDSRGTAVLSGTVVELGAQAVAVAKQVSTALHTLFSSSSSSLSFVVLR